MREWVVLFIGIAIGVAAGIAWSGNFGGGESMPDVEDRVNTVTSRWV